MVRTRSSSTSSAAAAANTPANTPASCQEESINDIQTTSDTIETNDVVPLASMRKDQSQVVVDTKKKKKKGIVIKQQTITTNKSRRRRNEGKEGEGNELSHIIPGYTAPMRLEAKSLKNISGASLSELRKRASREDSSMYTPSLTILDKYNNDNNTFDLAVAAKKVNTPSSIAIQKNSARGVRKIPTSFSSSFRKGPRKQHDNTAGSGWFNMTPTPMSDQLKTDLSIIRNRNYLDPKKFYKSADSFKGKVLQVGTVIEGSAEYYSSRLVKRDRRQNITEEIMADGAVSSYAKRKYQEIQSTKPQKRRKGGGKRGRGGRR